MPSKYVIRRAVEIALTSNHEFKVGCVLFKGPTVLRAMPNTTQYIGYRDKQFPFIPTRHAEIAAMHNIPRDVLKECSILVVRVNRKGGLTCAKPCKACLKSMIKAGIRQVWYTDYKGELCRLDVRKIYIPTYTKEKVIITE